MIRINKNKASSKFRSTAYSGKFLLSNDQVYRDVKEELLTICEHKCVYCETSINNIPLEIDHFRPYKGALNVVTGEFHPNHYSWLENSWDNFLLVCVECSRSKSNRFPVEGQLCEVGALGKELQNERRLLIDPSKDRPVKHFIYRENGEMVAKTKKGKYTIDVLNLNRSYLVEKREEKFKFLQSKFLNQLNKIDNEVLKKEILYEVYSYKEFSGMSRFFISLWIDENYLPWDREFEEYFTVRNAHRNRVEIIDLKALNYSTQIEKFSNSLINKTDFKIKEDWLDLQKVYKTSKIDQYIVSKDVDKSSYYMKQRFIEAIEIRNFKSIKNVKFDLRLSKSSNAPWLMLLGENGVGKSSVLQAIALALMGEDKRQQLFGSKSGKFLREGAETGEIAIYLTGEKEPIILAFSRGRDNFSGKNHVEPKVLLLGYGATRLLPRKDMEHSFNISWSRIENLFNPFVPLVDADDYFSYLDEKDFKVVSQAIESLFLEEVEVKRVDNKVRFKFHNSTSQLEDLSDGYQTIIALATDIMMVMKNRWRNFDAEGVVLIDELDSHLHPRWNIEIVSRLKRAFPKIQFISTTHNPLTLRGLIKGEVAVIIEDEMKQRIVIQDLPSQGTLDVEELLTSKFFGLYDTMMPEINNIFDEYYLLLSNPNPSEQEIVKINKLKNELGSLGRMGSTTRDQLFYEAIDYYLAKNKELDEGQSKDYFKNILEKTIKSFEK